MEPKPNFNNLKTYLTPKIDALEMSYEQFARAIGVTRAMIYFYMADKNRPTEEVAGRIATVLGVDLAEVLQQYTPKKIGRPRGATTS
jgi:transcriptional regulator with XRE-family HTH domain